MKSISKLIFKYSQVFHFFTFTLLITGKCYVHLHYLQHNSLNNIHTTVFTTHFFHDLQLCNYDCRLYHFDINTSTEIIDFNRKSSPKNVPFII